MANILGKCSQEIELTLFTLTSGVVNYSGETGSEGNLRDGFYCLLEYVALKIFKKTINSRDWKAFIDSITVMFIFLLINLAKALNTSLFHDIICKTEQKKLNDCVDNDFLSHSRPKIAPLTVSYGD